MFELVTDQLLPEEWSESDAEVVEYVWLAVEGLAARYTGQRV